MGKNKINVVITGRSGFGKSREVGRAPDVENNNNALINGGAVFRWVRLFRVPVRYSISTIWTSMLLTSIILL